MKQLIFNVIQAIEGESYIYILGNKIPAHPTLKSEIKVSLEHIHLPMNVINHSFNSPQYIYETTTKS
jgi:hypothetical protein